MSYKRTGLAALIPVGFQEINLTNSTAVGLDSTARDAWVLDISVETNSVRFRVDGTDPTLTTGVLLATGYYRLQGYNNTSALKFQRSTGSAKVSVMSYKHPGDQA